MQFYEKFSIRFRIADLLEYLWEVPSHRAAWIRVGGWLGGWMGGWIRGGWMCGGMDASCMGGWAR